MAGLASMDSLNTTTIILDLRDRMARIETKLDGHNEQHVAIDRRFDDLEARTDENASRISEASAEIAAAKVRVATLAAVASGTAGLLGVVGKQLWTLLVH